MKTYQNMPAKRKKNPESNLRSEKAKIAAEASAKAIPKLPNYKKVSRAEYYRAWRRKQAALAEVRRSRTEAVAAEMASSVDEAVLSMDERTNQKLDLILSQQAEIKAMLMGNAAAPMPRSMADALVKDENGNSLASRFHGAAYNPES